MWAVSSLTFNAPNYLIGIFTHLKLYLADAIHNFKRVKIIDSDLKHLLIDVTFYL